MRQLLGLSMEEHRRLAEVLRHRGLGDAGLLERRLLAVERPVVGPASLISDVAWWFTVYGLGFMVQGSGLVI